tara:strand:- start:227 stop:730 length:504 start_codon:yes stop_codon:yes gene_type:complete
MASGFIEADVSGTVTLGPIHTSTGLTSYDGVWGGNGGAINGIKLTQSGSVGSSIALPTSGVRWSHIELVLQDSANTNPIDHNVKVFLSWDITGDDICGGPSDSANMVECRGSSHGSNCFMVGIDLDMQPAIPPDGATNEIYLWIAGTGFNDNTPILKRARLYWHEIF